MGQALSIVEATTHEDDKSKSAAELFARVRALGELIDTLGKEERPKEALIEELVAAQADAAERLIAAHSRSAEDAVQKLMLWAYENPDLSRPAGELTVAERAGMAALKDLRRLLLDQGPGDRCVFGAVA